MGVRYVVHGRAQRRSRHWLELWPGPAAERYRVIAFDRPGIGHIKRPRDRLWTAATQAELLHNTFASLGIERLIVLGHSWGALTALKLALRKTAAVRRLVLVSGYYFPTARIDVPIFATPAIPIMSYSGAWWFLMSAAVKPNRRIPGHERGPEILP